MKICIRKIFDMIIELKTHMRFRLFTHRKKYENSKSI